jgi:hypothetical protein
MKEKEVKGYEYVQRARLNKALPDTAFDKIVPQDISAKDELHLCSP